MMMAQSGVTLSSCDDLKIDDLILANTDVTYLLVNSDLNIIHYNDPTARTIEKVYGVKIYKGFCVLDLAPAERREPLKKLYRNVFSGQKEKSTVALTIDGEPKIFENDFRPAYSRPGQIVGALVTSYDITARHLAEQKLKEAEERWRFALEGARQGVWDWNIETGAVYYSAACKKIYGYEEDELKGGIAEWQLMIHPDDRQRVMAAVDNHILHNDYADCIQYRLRHKNGHYIWIEARGMVTSRRTDGTGSRMIGTHTDVTKQITSRERYKLLFYYNPLPMWTFNPDTGRFLEVNNAAIQHYGYSRDEFTQLHIQDIVCPQFHQTLSQDLKALLETGSTQKIYSHVTKNGCPIKVEVACTLLAQEGRRKVLVSAKDITEKQHYAEQLQLSNELYKTVTLATHDMIWDMDVATRRIWWSDDFYKQFGWAGPDGYITLADCLSHIHPDDVSEVNNSLADAINDPGQSHWSADFRYRKADGNYAYVTDRAYIIRNEQMQARRVIGAMQDITERKKLEAELVQNVVEYQKAINKITVETQEQERKEIGKELHDNINQVLTTTKLYLDLAMSNEDLRSEMIRKSSSNIINVINEIRQISRLLMEPSIGDLGLKETISDLVENINMTRQLKASFTADASIEDLMDKNQKVALFRIIQEALNNVMKHAQAGHVTIALTAGHLQGRLLIQDNGKGFHPQKVKKGVGLKNIQNRIYLINGSYHLESAPGIGTRISILFPLNNNTNQHPV